MAGVYTIGVVEEFRRQGIGEAMNWAVLRAGREAGSVSDRSSVETESPATMLPQTARIPRRFTGSENLAPIHGQQRTLRVDVMDRFWREETVSR